MEYQLMNQEEMKNHFVGEAVTVTAVMAILTVAIMAVVIIFWNKIWPFGKKTNAAPLSKSGVGAWIKKDIFVLWFHILLSCIPAAVVGVLWDDLFEELFYHPIPVALALIVFGVAFIIVENMNAGKNAKITAVADISYMFGHITPLLNVTSDTTLVGQL